MQLKIKVLKVFYFELSFDNFCFGLRGKRKTKKTRTTELKVQITVRVDCQEQCVLTYILM